MTSGGPAVRRQVVLLGLESRYAHDVLDILASVGIGLGACVRSDHDTEVAGEFPVLIEKSALAPEDHDVVIPLLTPGRRRLRVLEAERIGLAVAPPCVHASAVISPNADLRDGAVVGAAVVIAPHVAAGMHMIVNRAASIGHDCRFGDYVTVGPGATLAGACVLEDGVYLGAGVVLCPKVRIGRNAVVGAGAVVTRDVEPGTVVVGNPARVLRRGVPGYRGIGV